MPPKLLQVGVSSVHALAKRLNLLAAIFGHAPAAYSKRVHAPLLPSRGLCLPVVSDFGTTGFNDTSLFSLRTDPLHSSFFFRDELLIDDLPWKSPRP
ncbi:hypothetical protein SODALDRAFT_363637 [Sodiomyces alkalinus F11]|uniref:Uncharacterized protein n=1 Tax=Sodiomyces alkalinus (strain CBS 110278 / VKM F-3762 / F11) TaxID=1314773 RepID=A0A3N2PKV1_SODAK|nr:hypothetical protein SODALDRAFT_363637 [Sodiomyces alkalinus F11]ROT34946.1 hypothetical protein SODALDRAFT_363637 [Sodiomyces alkalinus F11]